MFTSITTMAAAISNMFASLFKLKESQVENQTTTEIIGDKKDFKKATDIAETIIEIAEKYKPQMTFAHKLRFSHLCERFRKYN